MKGNEMEIYEPRFFYTGFRYVEVDSGYELELLVFPRLTLYLFSSY